MASEPPTLRERQAAFTRQEILAAARRLFAERGFTRTSVRDIAQAAGVSTQTVYDSIGSKQAVVARLNDLIDSEAGIGDLASATASSQDPRQVASMSARITRSILDHCEDIVRALVTGAAAEPELQEVLDEGHRRHLDGARTVVRLLREMRALRQSTDDPTAAETLAALTDFRYALLLRESYGWSPQHIEEWMAQGSRQLLLD